jgi:hypothetical protein
LCLVIVMSHGIHSMSKKVFVYFGLIISVFGTLLALSNLPVRRGYIEYKLYNTQYEKLVWLGNQFDEGKLKNGNFDFIVIGSSSALYGFNDSLATLKTINLGVNTGCRAMELYLLERFLKSGNKTKRIVKEYHVLNNKNFDYYGLHPVLHYFVSPVWLFQHDQALIQPHMFEYILNRCRVVFQSWFYFHTKADYSPDYTSYGYRAKLGKISERKYIKSTSEAPLTGIANVGGFRSWYHNYKSQKSFRTQTDQLSAKHFENISYLYFPTLNSLTAQRMENGSLMDKIITLKKTIGLELNVLNLGNDFAQNRSNWSDPGHYTTKGSRTFSDSLFRYCSQLR